jgi:hypothetical protein
MTMNLFASIRSFKGLKKNSDFFFEEEVIIQFRLLLTWPSEKWFPRENESQMKFKIKVQMKFQIKVQMKFQIKVQMKFQVKVQMKLKIKVQMKFKIKVQMKFKIKL